MDSIVPKNRTERRAAKTADRDVAEINQLIKEIRACFNRLRTVGDQLHDDIGVTAAMRAVLETLYEAGAQTVPNIARSKSVSRQHIQALVDQLVTDGLVQLTENPRHKRSQLVELTAGGSRTFDTMRGREFTALSDLVARLNSDDTNAARQHLGLLHAALDDMIRSNDKTIGD